MTRATGEDTVVFVGDNWLSFEQMCCVLQSKGVATYWIGYPSTRAMQLRTRLFTPVSSASSPQELRARLLDVGPARILDIIVSEYNLADVLAATDGLPLREEVHRALRGRATWLDKQSTMEALAGVGIPVPRQAPPDADARGAVEALGLPLVVKGRIGAGGRAVRICTTSEQVEQAYRDLAPSHPFAEEFQDGQDGLCYAAAVREDGTVLQEVCYTGVRSAATAAQWGQYSPLDEQVTLDDPELLELGRRTVAAVGGAGLINLDAIRNDDGRLAVIDVNPRPWGSVVAMRAAGVDFVDGYLAALRGLPFPHETVAPHRRVQVFSSTLLTGSSSPREAATAFASAARAHRAWTGDGYIAAEIVQAAAMVTKRTLRSTLARRRGAGAVDGPDVEDAADPAGRPAAGEQWIVIGGGATGAAIALEGSTRGHHVTLVDKNPSLGGLTATETFHVNGADVEVDRFYHVVLESDTRVLHLLDELGLADTVRWSTAPSEIVADGRRHPATSLVEMATLPMLKLSDRARIGASVAASMALPLTLANQMTAVDWLRRTAGRSALAAFWGPILRAKLGTQATRVSATFMVSTFRRLVQAKLKGAGDRFGVLPGGYTPVFDEMLRRVQAAGGEVRTGVQATLVEARTGGGVRVTLDDGQVLEGDRAFVTTPAPIVEKLVPALTAAERSQLTAAPYLGVVCGTFLLEEPPNPCYITYLVDDVDLTGVIGMHALLGTEQTAGTSLVYLPHYCGSDDEWFELDDDEVRRRMLAGLEAAFPDFEPRIVASSINRARHVVPLPVPGAKPPVPFATSVPGVHVVGTAQNTTGTLNVESSLELVHQALHQL